MKKIFLGILVNFFLTTISYSFTSYLLNVNFNLYIYSLIILFRISLPFIILNDYKLSWSKASSYSAFIKLLVNFLSLVSYAVIIFILYDNFNYSLLVFEFLVFLFLILISIYFYNYFLTINKKNTNKIIIYGSGKAGISVYKELSNINNVIYFIDDNRELQLRSIDGIPIHSQQKAINDDKIINYTLIIAMPSNSSKNIKEIYDLFKNKVSLIKILPPSSMIYRDKPFISQLKKISILDLLARNPKDLNNEKISAFIKNKSILITGSAGTIGSELIKIAILNGSKKIIALDHNEFGQYKLLEKNHANVDVLVGSVLNKGFLDQIFKKYKLDIVLHAAAYKHVHLSEYSLDSTLKNNIIGTKNIVDLSIKNEVEKFILISTDKAVNPTNIMGASKSICELYCQNIKSNNTKIISVRFGNVLGSSGSVIPKFQKQIDNDNDISVTHKNITRFFMLVNEACNLVYQAASIGNHGEILILDMGEPIKISDLANKMIELSGKKYLKIKYTGLRKGEKLYEELLFNEKDKKTQFDSITIANKREVNFKDLQERINSLINDDVNKVEMIKKILPDFKHLRDN
tara:strand:+ start:1238 stop:2962 length:1725 start_codon:yes stop_codon:yes gene_type:complete